MSEITIMCPYCGAALSGDSDFLGEEVGCPDCGNKFVAEAVTDFHEESVAAPAGEESVSASLKRFRLDPEVFKKIPPAESFEAQQDPNDSVFTDTERGVKRPAAFRRQSPHNHPGYPAAAHRTIKTAPPRRHTEKFVRASDDDEAASASPARKTVPAGGRKKKPLDQLLAGKSGTRVFELNPWFWIFFSIGVIMFSIGVFNVLNASEYDGEFKDWGGTRVYQPNSSRNGDISLGDPAFAAAKNTVVLCEGLKCINRNFGNIGSHYQGLQEMFIGFTLIFGSGFFFFCALISFLYSARLPEKE